jgi:hypothetical protein
MSYVRGVVVLVALFSMTQVAVAADKRSDAARLYREGKYDDALKLFQDLAVETHNPGYLCNIGRCQDKLNRVDEAVTNIQQCLAQANPDGAKRAEYEALLGQLEARRRLAVAPAAAVVAPAGTLPPPSTAVAPGLPGAQAPGLAPVAPSLPDSPVAPPFYPGGAAGVVATQPPPPPPSTGGGVSGLVIAGGAVALVGVGGGVLFGLQARKAYRDTAARYNPAREKDGDRANIFQIVGYGVGAVGVGLLIIGAVMSSSSASSHASASHTLVAGADGVGWTF